MIVVYVSYCNALFFQEIGGINGIIKFDLYLRLADGFQIFNTSLEKHFAIVDNTHMGSHAFHFGQQMAGNKYCFLMLE